VLRIRLRLLPRCRCLLTALRARALSLSLSLFLQPHSSLSCVLTWSLKYLLRISHFILSPVLSLFLLTETMLVYQQKDLPKDPVFVPDLEKLG
jgi:hypothetical protein